MASLLARVPEARQLSGPRGHIRMLTPSGTCNMFRYVSTAWKWRFPAFLPSV